MNCFLNGRDFYNLLVNSHLRASLIDLRSTDEFNVNAIVSAQSLPLKIKEIPNEETEKNKIFKHEWERLNMETTLGKFVEDNRYLFFIIAEYNESLLFSFILIANFLYSSYYN